MRKLVFLLIISVAARAQEPDSLLPRILALDNDTERVNQLYKRGFGMRNVNPQLAYTYAIVCEQQAKNTSSGKHLAKSYNLLGVLYYKKGDYTKALTFHKKALALRETCGDVLGIAYSQTNLGNVFSDLKLFVRAESAYLQAMDAYKQAGMSEKVTSCLINIATIKHSLKQYDAAIENYNMAIALAPLNDYETKALLLTNMAVTYVAKNNLDKAIACNEDALKLRQMLDNNLETADNYLNLGGIYIARREFTRAKQLIDTACNIARQNDYSDLLYKAAKINALYYHETGQNEDAYYWMKKYSDLSDSLVIQQHIARQIYDFSDEQDGTEVSVNKPGNNFWLLLGIFLGLIAIPFYLIRFKR